jgi:hypothetical protein
MVSALFDPHAKLVELTGRQLLGGRRNVGGFFLRHRFFLGLGRRAGRRVLSCEALDARVFVHVAAGINLGGRRYLECAFDAVGSLDLDRYPVVLDIGRDHFEARVANHVQQ